MHQSHEGERTSSDQSDIKHGNNFQTGRQGSTFSIDLTVPIPRIPTSWYEDCRWRLRRIAELPRIVALRPTPSLAQQHAEYHTSNNRGISSFRPMSLTSSLSKPSRRRWSTALLRVRWYIRSTAVRTATAALQASETASTLDPRSYLTHPYHNVRQ